LGYFGSSLLVTNPRKSGSMVIDSNERSNRGGAGGIIGDFLSFGKELGGKEAEIAEDPRRKPCVRTGAVYKLLKLLNYLVWARGFEP
jgi:hypothetical protein